MPTERGFRGYFRLPQLLPGDYKLLMGLREVQPDTTQLDVVCAALRVAYYQRQAFVEALAAIKAQAPAPVMEHVHSIREFLTGTPMQDGHEHDHMGIPPEWRGKLGDLAGAFKLTPAQVMVLGLRAVLAVGQQDPKAVEALAQEVRDRVPA